MRWGVLGLVSLATASFLYRYLVVQQFFSLPNINFKSLQCYRLVGGRGYDNLGYHLLF